MTKALLSLKAFVSTRTFLKLVDKAYFIFLLHFNLIEVQLTHTIVKNRLSILYLFIQGLVVLKQRFQCLENLDLTGDS